MRQPQAHFVKTPHLVKTDIVKMKTVQLLP